MIKRFLIAALLAAASLGTLAANQQVPLLENAAATGSAAHWPGGPGVVTAEGTWAGATATLQVLSPNGTWVSTGVTFTANGTATFSAPTADLRIAITGGPPTALYIYAVQNDKIITAATASGAVTIADGANTVEGATTDAAATAGGAGTISAKLRLATTLLNDIDINSSRLLSSAAAATPAAALATTGFISTATYNATPPTWTDTWQGSMQVDKRGNLRTTRVQTSTGTQTSVAATGADATCLAANADRRGATLFNDATVVAYVLLSNAVSSSTAYTVQIAAGGYYEVPFDYTGVIKCIAASGSMRVTELVQ